MDMDGEKTVGRGFRFGTFRFDPVEGGLYCGEHPLDLQDLPQRLLSVLLEQPGVTVPRDVLYERLWPDTFVDCERGLNTAVRKLRRAIGDSADQPVFVETVPRRGYRFIAPVESWDPTDLSLTSPARVMATPPVAAARWVSIAAAALATVALIVTLAGRGTEPRDAYDGRDCPDRTAKAPVDR